MNDEIVIAVPSECRRFKDQVGVHGVDALEETLRTQDSTEPVEINRMEDVMLSANGFVQGNFRFTTTGLSQLCSALAPGLAQLLGNLAGLRRKEVEEDEWKVYDPRLAIHQLNDVIRLRFAKRLVGHGLIMDIRNERVEGVVGPRYKFLSNLELFERSRDFARELDPSARFLEASLSGRRLVVRYRDAAPLFTVKAPNNKREPFYRGWHFSNSEIGDCSVRTGMLIVRQWRKTSSLLDVGRLVHLKGGDFGPKIGELFNKLQSHADAAVEEHDFESLAKSLQDESLRLGGDPVTHVKRAQSMVGRLSRGRLSKLVSKKVLNHALATGSYRTDKIDSEGGPTYDAPDSGLLKIFSGRKMYDLYNALTAAVREASTEQQEFAEELAYRMLTQRFKPQN